MSPAVEIPATKMKKKQTEKQIIKTSKEKPTWTSSTLDICTVCRLYIGSKQSLSMLDVTNNKYFVTFEWPKKKKKINIETKIDRRDYPTIGFVLL